MPALEDLFRVAEFSLNQWGLLDGDLGQYIHDPFHILLIKDEGGRVIYASEVLSNRLGIHWGTMKGKTMDVSLPNDRQAAHMIAQSDQRTLRSMKPDSVIIALSKHHDCCDYWQINKTAVLCERGKFIVSIWNKVNVTPTSSELAS